MRSTRLARSPSRLALVCLVGVAVSLSRPRPAQAADPDPTNAVLLGATSTLLPIAVGSGLLATGRREAEGVRLAASLSALSVGAAFGPSIGQLYAGAGVDAVVTLLLRSLTTGLTVTGLALTLRGGAEDRTPAVALMVLGGIPTAFLAGFDILDAADTAREARIRGSARDDPELRELYAIAVCGPIPCSTSALLSEAREP